MSKGASRVVERSSALRAGGAAPRAGGIRHRAFRWVLATVALAVGLIGCVYDADERCSPGQVSYGPGLCACAAGSVLTPLGCMECGENAAPGAGGTECVCSAGFSRPAPGQPCVAAPSALGAPCETAGSTCPDAVYDVCVAPSGGAGYCTRGCSSAQECEGGYACDLAAEPPYCRRPPVGAGDACESDADCAGTEATFCDSFVLHQCVVQGCSEAADDCFSGTQCCEQLAPVPLCLPNGAC